MNIREQNKSDFWATIKCGLATKEGILLTTFHGTTPMNLLRVKWTDSGSVSILKKNFTEENRFCLVLDELLLSMNLSALSFLGAGGTGCVFEVCD